MNRFSTALALCAALSAPAGFAQNHTGHGGAVATAAFVDGEVRRVDLDTGKLTLRHAEIKYLDMTPMTMVFTAKNKALLAGLKAGDRIRFKAAHEGETYWVTAIEGR